jgi:hypothetical protein
MTGTPSATAKQARESLERSLELHLARSLGPARGISNLGKSFPLKEALDDERSVLLRKLVERCIQRRQGFEPRSGFIRGSDNWLAGEGVEFPLMALFGTHDFGAFKLGRTEYPRRQVRVSAQ